jgi:endonuclease/exonuclease/phosphatase family metal-dependent hydrolase
VLKNAGLRNSYVWAEEVGEVCATSPGGTAVIDFILCSDDMSVPFYTVVTDATNPSDHRPIYAWVKY